jgi:hypothetical protein
MKNVDEMISENNTEWDNYKNNTGWRKYTNNENTRW